jgi:hypothetical protein
MFAIGAQADELQPAGIPVEKTIDHYVDSAIKANGISSAPMADDATFIRRVTLDLCGRIPTAAETREYVESKTLDKREKLVDRLMQSSGFVRYQASEFDAMLMQGASNGRRGGGSLRDYLERSIASNRPWNEVFKDLILPDDNDAAKKGAGEFLKPRLTDVDKLTTEVSILFFGVNMSCARCHDHPLVADWKQDHFFGMKSFFNRTFDNGGFLAEREFGLVKFQTTKGQNKDAQMMFLTGKVVSAPGMKEPTKDEEKKEKERFEEFKKKKAVPPPPKFSARSAFVETALQPEQRGYFSKAIVNRLWNRFFGLGLVNPVDQMHSENAPSHPELLEWLARDLVDHRYDLKRTIRGVVLSHAYGRSSRWDSNGEPPAAKWFAVARVRPLTPLQLANSLRIATSDPQTFENTKPADLEKKIEQIESSARGLANMFEYPNDDFQIGAGEALLFSNSDRMQKDLLADGGDRLFSNLKKLKTNDQVVELTVSSILCRPATSYEKQMFNDFLAKRIDRPADAQRQLVWAFLTTSEFRFNH